MFVTMYILSLLEDAKNKSQMMKQSGVSAEKKCFVPVSQRY